MQKRNGLRQPLGRRSFLIGAAGVAAAACAGSAFAAPSTLSPMTLESDPRVAVKTVTIPGSAANLSGYLVTPTHPELATGYKPVAGRSPGIVLVGEDRGLNAHIKDLARRFGTEGFVVLAIDYLSPLGGTPVDGATAADMAQKQNPADVVAYARQAIAYLKTVPGVGRVGVVGFGKGGMRVNELVEVEPGIGAAVAYYAGSPNLNKVGDIRAPLLEHYAAQDERHMLEFPKFEAAIKRAGKPYQLYIYTMSKLGFTDDTNLNLYDQVNSELAWGRSVAFLHKYLG